MVCFVGRFILVSLLWIGGCTAGARGTPKDAHELRATMRGVYAAVERGDEVMYRQLVEIVPGDAYSDALTTTMFESVRLHQAVERHIGREAATRGDAGAAASLASSRPSGASGPTTMPRAPLTAVDYRINARSMLSAIETWTFTVRGDRATIDALADRPEAPVLKRLRGGRWVVSARPWDTPRETATYRQAVLAERGVGQVLAAARRRVEEGKVTSVADVNAYIRSLLERATTQSILDESR